MRHIEKHSNTYVDVELEMHRSRANNESELSVSNKCRCFYYGIYAVI